MNSIFQMRMRRDLRAACPWQSKVNSTNSIQLFFADSRCHRMAVQTLYVVVLPRDLFHDNTFLNFSVPQKPVHSDQMFFLNQHLAYKSRYLPVVYSESGLTAKCLGLIQPNLCCSLVSSRSHSLSTFWLRSLNSLLVYSMNVCLKAQTMQADTWYIVQ